MQDNDWPTICWKTAPPEVEAMDSTILTQMDRYVADTFPTLLSVLLVRHGSLVFEHSYQGYHARDSVNSKSVTKSIVSALVGIALREHFLTSLDQRLVEFFPQDFPADGDPRKQEITLKHLLTLRSGLSWVESSAESLPALFASDNWVQHGLSLPLLHAPGEVFTYSTLDAHLLSAVLAQVSGMSTLEFANQYLFGSLGSKATRWASDPQGYQIGGSELYLTPRDMATVQAYLAAGDPVVSVDAKKKELVGDFKNGGREWHPQGEPEQVRVYDFPISGLGRATPYGIYEPFRNAGWVNVGIDHNTAAFAVESLRRWWNTAGHQQYPQAKRLLISADGGGSNGLRVRLWKWELQQLADETGLAITVCHLPPGTSKWNKIEHRLFAWISQNWRGRPLTSYAVILKLIAATTTKAGLTVQCQLDINRYPSGRKVSDKEMATISLLPDSFHGQWNYTIMPRKASN